MSKKTIRPYGAWSSPITSDLIVAETIGLAEITLAADDIYWLEMRPGEGGRVVIVRRRPDGTVHDINPAPFNARTRVHEYGGGSYLVDGETVYFSNFADQRLYRATPDTEPEALTPPGEFRYADAVIDRRRERLVCVREDHSRGGSEPTNEIVGISLATGRCSADSLVSGADFYSNPRISPDGRFLCWLCWNHPNMPWDGTELWLAEIGEEGMLVEPRLIAGGVQESIFQPEWSPDGTLYFISDRTGWWNLYRWQRDRISSVVRMEAEFGVPQWVFRESTYAFASAERIICTYSQYGRNYLATIDTASGQLDVIDIPYSELGSITVHEEKVVFLGASPDEFPAIIDMEIATAEYRIIRSASGLQPDTGFISIGEPIEFPTTNDTTAYGFYYSPVNADFTAPEGEMPPLLVISHGGPTAAAHNGLKLVIQFFTSRGFAVLDVNYGGSTGYGRAYRERLNGQWGIVDVDDCTNGALYLASRGNVDRQRLAIRGGSAGGFTTLAALAFRDVFTAGASHYGVCDLEALARETHKFESHYLEKLVGPYPARADLYRERSPIYAVERLSCPIIFFQGLEDRIVPPNQAEKMVTALKKKGLPVAYLAYEGEQHGFRQAKNIKRTLDAELYFYSRIFSFEAADLIEPVAIANLDRTTGSN